MDSIHLQEQISTLNAQVDALRSSTGTLESKIEEFSKLLDVARHLTHFTSLDDLLAYIAAQVTSVLGADRCTIFLLDAVKNEIYSKLVTGRNEEIRFPGGQGLAGHTIATGELLRIDHPYDDPRFNRTIDDETGYRTQNLVCVPLNNLEGRTTGCFQVVNKLDGAFKNSDVEYLEAFASQAAVAIESTRLYEEKEGVIRELIVAQAELRQKVRQLEIVYDLEKGLSDIVEFDDFVKHIIRRTSDAVSAMSGAILLYDAPTESRTLYSLSPFESNSFRQNEFNESEGILSHVMETGAEILENKPGSSPFASRRVEDLTGIKPLNTIVVPLKLSKEDRGDHSKNAVSGGLQVYNHVRGYFTEDDVAVVKLIAALSSAAILRKHLMEDRQKSQRLATVGTLASTIIHDFKNPMGIIRGYAEFMERMEMPRPQQEKFCKIIVAEVDRCVNMTKELLYFSRGEKNYDFKTVPIEDFIGDVTMVLENEMEQHKIQFIRDLGYRGSARLDQEKMKRVLFNLSNNAMSVLKEGGVFRIETVALENRFQIRVIDSGPGIPQSIRKTLFTPFVTHGKKDGTGLGLAIVKDIVGCHDGEIYLDENHEDGACFVIDLPIPQTSL